MDDAEAIRSAIEGLTTLRTMLETNEYPPSVYQKELRNTETEIWAIIDLLEDDEMMEEFK